MWRGTMNEKATDTCMYNPAVKSVKARLGKRDDITGAKN